MRTITQNSSVPAFFLFLLIATTSITLTSCGDEANDGAGYDAATRGDSLRNADGTYTFNDGTVRNADGSYTYRDGSLRNADGTEYSGTRINADGTVTNADGTVNNDGPVLTPAEERNETLTDLQAMRTRLMAELETVRTRLNAGTLTPDEQAKQTTRAGELAQGLERLDRAIEQVNQTDDATWPAVKSNSQRGAEDFRAWMRKNDVQMEG